MQLQVDFFFVLNQSARRYNLKGFRCDLIYSFEIMLQHVISCVRITLLAHCEHNYLSRWVRNSVPLGRAVPLKSAIPNMGYVHHKRVFIKQLSG